MSPNCSVSSPLSQSQKDIWALMSTGLSVTKIAEKLKTTRQYVNQTRLMAEAKLSTTLLDVAQVNDLQVTKLYPKQAIFLGYHPALKRKPSSPTPPAMDSKSGTGTTTPKKSPTQPS